LQSKLIRGAGALAVLALIAGCATPERPAPRASAAANVDAGASRLLAAQASAFESFVRKASGVDGSFAGPSEVSQALAAGASHDPQQLQAGMVAYAAMAALQEPRFVAAVRGQRGDLARRLAADPQLALDLPGADAAAARAAGALYAEGQALQGSGQQVKRASYSVQHQAWSKRDAGGRARLERVKQISRAGYQPARDDGARLMAALAQGGRRGGTASPLVARGVALAALTAMGQEGAGRGLMSDAKTGACLRIAKLNLYQCLSAAGPHYEDIYCLGEHAMIEPGQCVVDATKPARSAPITRASYRR
jgi:hypothetical protein